MTFYIESHLFHSNQLNNNRDISLGPFGNAATFCLFFVEVFVLIELNGSPKLL